jgi:O-antigen/teichoic acid export membrane protein
MARVARGSTANLIGAAATAICAFMLTVVVARGLSRAHAGVFFSTTSLFLVATAIGQLGTQTALVYFLSRSRALGRPGDMDAYLRTALRAVVSVAVVMTVGLLVLSRPLAEITSPKHVDEATAYLRILAFFVPLAGIEAALLSATRGLGSMRANTVIEQIGRPLAQLFLVAGATLATSTTLVGLAWSIAYLPAAIGAWLAWRKLRAKHPRPGRDDPPPSSAGFWRFALPRALTSIIQMVMQRFDIVLVGALSGAVDAAIYAAATRFIVVGQLGTNALTLATQPQLAQKLAVHDHRGANELYQISTAWLILVTWPIYLIMILFGKPLLLVFGSGYSGGRDAMLLISLSMLVATGLGMVDTVLSMAGHTSWNLGNALLALACNLGLDVWLIPSHGIVGAAIGWAVAIVVRNIAALTQVGVSLRYHPFARSSAVAAGLTVACYFLVLGAVRITVGENVIGLLAGLVIATAPYLCGLWLLRGALRLDALTGLRRRGR